MLPVRWAVATMNLQAQVLCDQLLAVLHSCPRPLSTSEITQAAPPLAEVHTWCNPIWHERGRSPRTREERCYDTHHVHVRSRYAREIYQALRAMADQGQIVRIRDPLLRTVSWAPLRPPRFVEELEACLALPCFTRVEDRQLGAD